MTFYRIRLKRYPDKWVGKKNIVNAIRSDQKINSRKSDSEPFYFPWFTKEKYARIYSSPGEIQRILTMLEVHEYAPYRKVEQTFGEYEVVIDENGSQRVEPLDNFKKVSK